MENHVGKHDGNMSVPAAVSSLLSTDSMLWIAHVIIYLLLCKQSAWQEGVVKWSLGWSSEIHTDYETHTSPSGSSQRILQCGATQTMTQTNVRQQQQRSRFFRDIWLSLHLSSKLSVLCVESQSASQWLMFYPPQSCISSTDWCELALHCMTLLHVLCSTCSCSFTSEKKTTFKYKCYQIVFPTTKTPHCQPLFAFSDQSPHDIKQSMSAVWIILVVLGIW